jgi:hypothetical protein
MIQDHVTKLMRGLDIGMGCTVVTGSEADLKSIKDLLKLKLADNDIIVSEVELDRNDIALNQSAEINHFLFVTGLEAPSPKDDITYAIRSFLDRGKHTGLRFIIFCEKSSCSAHFNDYDAPFYQFCFHHPIKD